MELVDPTLVVIFGVFDGCAGWIAGLMLLVVGLVTVRKALPVAGYLVGAAGALQLISSCCAGWQEPAMAWFELYELTENLGPFSSGLSFLSYLGVAGLLIAAGVMLAKKVMADAPEGPAGGGAT